ncbi:g9675 [Coccomyxa elongata]
MDNPSRRVTFQQLQPICSCLLQHRSDARELSNALRDLNALLQTVDGVGLLGCSDYVLYPLLFIVDSIYVSRNKPDGPADAAAVPPVPAAKSDKVAELALSCCKTLLERCPPPDRERVLELLHRIGAVAALKREAAAEEVRRAALEGLVALLGGLPCNSASSSEALRAETSTPLVAATAVMLQEAASAEASAGLHGSKAVRISALRALRLLYEAVNDAQALSYVLPGAVGGLSKALLQGSAMTRHGERLQTGAAASATALVEAVNGLFSVICITLSDESTATARSTGVAAQQSAGGEDVQSSSDALKALEGLQRLAVAPLPHQAGQGEPPPEAPRLPQQKTPARQGAPSNYRVNRDAAWLKNTVTHLEQLLRRVLPPLCSNRHSKVRRALAEGVCHLLLRCRHTLAPCSELLLEMAFTLAADSWPNVAAPARAWLAQVQAEGSLDTHLPQASMEAFISRLLRQLLPAVRALDGCGLALANRLAAALQVADVQLVASRVLQNPVQLGLLCTSLCQCFEFDGAAAGSLLHAPHEGGTHVAQPPRRIEAGIAEGATEDDAEGRQPHKERQSARPQAALSAISLPRMPIGLSHMSSQAAYDAVAGIARTAGRVASLAGGTVLRGLLDRLLSDLRKLLPGTSRQRDAPTASWQLSAASVVVVTSEVIYGASAAWQPANYLGAQPGQAEACDGSGASGTSDGERLHQTQAEVEAMVVMIEEEWVREPLWGVITSTETSQHESDASLTPQVLAQNAVLAKALLEGVGAFARALGHRFAAGGRLMYTVLIPLLERLADPCPSVASSAAAAVGSLCLHSGYSGLEDLVRENADYIVDGLCRQLRHLDSHPRAPHLFAGLLRCAGVAPALLPLLAEPARAAVAGLAITARRKRPAHTAAFLAALREICAGAHSDAATVLEASEAAASAVEKKSAARRQAYREQEAEAEKDFERGKSEEEVRQYFMQHLQQEQQRDKGEAALDHGDEANSAAQVPWSLEDWAQEDERLRRAHADATLAHSAALVAGPLLTSPDLRVLLLAMDVARGALQALQQTSAVLDIHENRIKPSVRKKTSVEPVPPETPQLLPTIHSLWSPLVNSLKDARVAAVERALAFLADYVDTGGGDFLARRFVQEAWPQLALLLHRGPNTALGSDNGDPAPAVVQRTRTAVLTALLRISSSSRSAAVLSQIVAKVADAVAVHMGDSASPAVRTTTRQLLVALATLDSDAVWLLLFRLQESSPGGRKVINPCPAILPDVRDIFGGGEPAEKYYNREIWDAHERRTDCRAGALLRQGAA